MADITLTEHEKLLGVKIKDMIDLYTLSQTHFRQFDGNNGAPFLTDEQLRAFIIPPWPFEHSQIQLYRLLTRRKTGQQQFKDLIRQHKAAAEKMLSEST